MDCHLSFNCMGVRASSPSSPTKWWKKLAMPWCWLCWSCEGVEEGSEGCRALVLLLRRIMLFVVACLSVWIAVYHCILTLVRIHSSSLNAPSPKSSLRQSFDPRLRRQSRRRTAGESKSRLRHSRASKHVVAAHSLRLKAGCQELPLACSTSQLPSTLCSPSLSRINLRIHITSTTTSHTTATMSSGRLWQIIGGGAAIGGAYYLYNAGGDPKAAEKRFEGTYTSHPLPPTHSLQLIFHCDVQPTQPKPPNPSAWPAKAKKRKSKAKSLSPMRAPKPIRCSRMRRRALRTRMGSWRRIGRRRRGSWRRLLRRRGELYNTVLEVGVRVGESANGGVCVL